MDEPTSRSWSRPELIVLVRSGPEEAVLTVCKGRTADGGPSSQRDGTCIDGETGLSCLACDNSYGS